MARLREELFAGEMARRGLHNTLAELKGNIRVFVRVRPFLPGDAVAAAGGDGGSGPALPDATLVSVISCAPDGTSLTIAPPRATGGKDALPSAVARSAGLPAKPVRFAFDAVLGPRTGQADVFAEVRARAGVCVLVH